MMEFLCLILEGLLLVVDAVVLFGDSSQRIQGGMNRVEGQSTGGTAGSVPPLPTDRGESILESDRVSR